MSCSNKKIRPQKGQGRARLGRKQAPGRHKGVKVHGLKVRMLDIAMPDKIKLLAMKTLLSAKLAEGCIVIVDNDYISERKTKNVEACLKNFSHKERFLYLSGYISEDFKVASENINRITYKTFDEATLTEVLKADRIIFNLDGILNLMVYLNEKTVLQHKPKAVKFHAKLIESLKQAEKEKDSKKTAEKVNYFDIACL